MAPDQAAYYNNKHRQFFLTRFSPITKRYVRVGKAYQTIQEALAAATRLDARDDRHMTFVDTVDPSKAKAA